MSKYRELEVWEDACQFAKELYGVVGDLRDFGFKDQITRAAVSIASNIAEGSERGSDIDFARFLRIAKGSCEECRTQLYIGKLVGYFPEPLFKDLDKQADLISKRLGALIKYLKN